MYLAYDACEHIPECTLVISCVLSFDKSSVILYYMPWSHSSCIIRTWHLFHHKNR
ncbi:hypothetical protein RchiOBHm_Chr4g0420681 [Rosa chinensis]|uniref:Uncharacterized protein n=1 Tax=Rosa chinensis TaxID=74649 RepID=A0A2P6QXZ7_ROSCH|nr:hypothetical protein RchiOBHm_Chr4g0420681 [Rosa chinensis]